MIASNCIAPYESLPLCFYPPTYYNGTSAPRPSLRSLPTRYTSLEEYVRSMARALGDQMMKKIEPVTKKFSQGYEAVKKEQTNRTQMNGNPGQFGSQLPRFYSSLSSEVIQSIIRRVGVSYYHSSHLRLIQRSSGGKRKVKRKLSKKQEQEKWLKKRQKERRERNRGDGDEEEEEEEVEEAEYEDSPQVLTLYLRLQHPPSRENTSLCSSSDLWILSNTSDFDIRSGASGEKCNQWNRPIILFASSSWQTFAKESSLLRIELLPFQPFAQYVQDTLPTSFNNDGYTHTHIPLHKPKRHF